MTATVHDIAHERGPFVTGRACWCRCGPGSTPSSAKDAGR